MPNPSAFRKALLAWSAASVLVILQPLAVYVRNGETGINLFIQHWSYSNPVVTLEAVACVWLLLGAALYLLANEKINAQNALPLAGFFLVLLSYLNILRERFRYGDYQYYLEAAMALYKNQPLPDTYVYLPLWATLLQFIAPLGDSWMLGILWALNIVWLGLFYFLLVRVLERYGFTPRFAVLAVTLFMLVNVPLHRTLGYVQVNLLVMVLILGALLSFGKNDFLSALLFALAVHLKTSPVALLPAFLLTRNWKWLGYFALSCLLAGLIPLALEGTQPYLDYLTNVRILAQLADTNFHDTSFDSFFRFLNPFFGIKIEVTRLVTTAMKAALGLAALWVMAQNVRRKSFADGEAAALWNALPALFVVMTLTSPIVWDHHGLFLTLAFLPLLKPLASAERQLWFGLAYFLEFLLPSFDFFPWSFGRLLAPLIVLYLCLQAARDSQPAAFFLRANRV